MYNYDFVANKFHCDYVKILKINIKKVLRVRKILFLMSSNEKSLD